MAFVMPRMDRSGWVALAVGLVALVVNFVAIALLDEPAPVSVACPVVLLPCLVFVISRLLRTARRP
jgi:hypothetical protein